MHLLETYALSCGLKIDKPYVFEHYTSIPFEKFISFNKRIYPFYLEVLELIQTELDQRGIKVLQIKAENGNVDINDNIPNNLSFGQWAYLIKHSLLHFGEDDFLFDLAAYYDVPRVILYSNTYPSNFKPYWGAEDKQRILFTTGPFAKPSFSSEPSTNFVKMLKPEDIAQCIMDLLGIPWSSPYKTIYAGSAYRPQHDIIEIVGDKDKPITLNGKVSTIGIRMDYNFDENFMASVLEKTKASIVTDKPLQIGILQALRTKISEIVYVVDETSDVQFVRELAKLNLPYALLCYNPSVALREKFFEVAIINTVQTVKLEDVKELQSGLKGLFYKSAKRTCHGSIEYKGRHQFVNNQPSLPNELSPCPENVSEDFLRELEFFFIVQPIA